MKRLLIINNDEEESALLAEPAKAFGYEVISTWSGREALEYAFTSHFDVAWVDHHIPDMYVGEVVQSLLQLASPPRTVLMLVPDMKPVQYGKSRECLEIRKSDIPTLFNTLSHDRGC